MKVEKFDYYSFPDFELKQTQQHLIESEKMAGLGGLVAGIAHEINTPVGIGLTAITHFIIITEELKSKYQQKKMTQKKNGSFCRNKFMILVDHVQRTKFTLEHLDSIIQYYNNMRNV